MPQRVAAMLALVAFALCLVAGAIGAAVDGGALRVIAAPDPWALVFICYILDKLRNARPRTM